MPLRNSRPPSEVTTLGQPRDRMSCMSSVATEMADLSCSSRISVKLERPSTTAMMYWPSSSPSRRGPTRSTCQISFGDRGVLIGIWGAGGSSPLLVPRRQVSQVSMNLAMSFRMEGHQ